MSSEGRVCVIIGAAGKLGRVLTDEALKRGMVVRAVVRPTNKHKDNRENVQVLRINIDDLASLNEAFQGADVIFVAIRGRSGFSNYNDMPRYIRIMVEAMIDDNYELKAGVERIIICSCISTTADGRSNLSFFSKLGALFNRGHLSDLLSMEKSCMDESDQNFLTKMSVADFTIVKPTTFMTGSPSDISVIGFQNDEKRKIRSSIPTVNVANYMFDVLYEGGGFSRDTVMIGLKV